MRQPHAASIQQMHLFCRGCSMLLLLLLLFITQLQVHPVHASSKTVSPKTINVGLSATWPSTPVLIEASEHMASISSDHYWNFLSALGNELTQRGSQTGHLTDEQQYTLAMTIATQQLGPASMQVMTTSLALRTHSVKAQLYHTLLLDDLTKKLGTDEEERSRLLQCAAVISYGSKIICDTEAAKLAFQETSGQTVQQGDEEGHY